MSYLKIVDNNIQEAPAVIERDGKVVYGYNKQNNEAMLFEDGYEYYDYPASNYIVVNGQIILKPIPEPVLETNFTKLQIRRAMRKLELEYKLDGTLSSDYRFNKEWSDAVEIDLNDPMIQQVISAGIISQEEYDEILKELNNDYTE